MREIDSLRVRLGHADQDGRKAWNEAAALLRQIINAEAEGVAARESVEALQRRLDTVAASLHELRALEIALMRLSGAALEAPAPRESPAAPACATCGRSDAMVSIPICARCSNIGTF